MLHRGPALLAMGSTAAVVLLIELRQQAWDGQAEQCREELANMKDIAKLVDSRERLLRVSTPEWHYRQRLRRARLSAELLTLGGAWSTVELAAGEALELGEGSCWVLEHLDGGDLTHRDAIILGPSQPLLRLAGLDDENPSPTLLALEEVNLRWGSCP